LTRHRATLQQDRVRVKQRIHKTLQDANLKLSSVISDVLGVSGRAMLGALVAGETDPARLADRADGRLKANRADLEAALTGRLRAHHRFVLGELLEQLTYLEAALARVSAEIAHQMQAQEATITRLDTIPGVNSHTAEVIVAEVGPAVDRFPSARHLASWAGLCPGNHESGGVRRSGRTRRGNVWLRRVLFQAAHAAVKQHGSFLHTLYQRLKPRLGAKKALVAVAHRLLVIVYCLLARQEPYREVDLSAHAERQQRQEQRLVARLERLGYTVGRPPAVPVAV
jgi:transposase